MTPRSDWGAGSPNASSRLPKPVSITHVHLVAAIVSEMKGRESFRIVEVGSGDGRFLSFLRVSLAILLPNSRVEIDGFDVSDRTPHGNDKLASGTRTVRVGEHWPYSDRSADVIVSNQVLEHVFDHRFFFSEIARCLRPNGVSIHLFPLNTVIYEDHVGIPLAHHFRRPSWIRLMMRLGFRSETRAKALPKFGDLQFPEQAVAYLNKYTNYVSRRSIKLTAEAAGLRSSFQYTPRLYLAKMRAVLKRPAVYSYAKRPLIDECLSRIMAYFAGITLVLYHIPRDAASPATSGGSD